MEGCACQEPARTGHSGTPALVLPPAQPELAVAGRGDAAQRFGAPRAASQPLCCDGPRPPEANRAYRCRRAAISASAGERALDLLRQYQEKYQGGTFAPEAAALKIEALAKLGRAAEARSGAERFRAQYGESPQTDRVLRAAGLAAP